MARFFFDISDDGRVYDLDGVELPDVAAAQREASLILCQLLPDKARHLWSGRPLVVAVFDARRAPLFSLETCVQLSPDPKPDATTPLRPAND